MTLFEKTGILIAIIFIMVVLSVPGIYSLILWYHGGNW